MTFSKCVTLKNVVSRPKSNIYIKRKDLQLLSHITIQAKSTEIAKPCYLTPERKITFLSRKAPMA